MRLRELRDRLFLIASHLELRTRKLDTTIQTFRVTNLEEVHDALRLLGALDLFDREVEQALNLQVISLGGDVVFAESDVRVAEAHISKLRTSVWRLAALLDGIVPPITGSGYAVRLPIGKDLRELEACVEALTLFEQAVQTLTGEKLAFGGFDVGSWWVNLLVEHLNTTVDAVVAALLTLAGTYARESYEKRKLLKDAQAAGFANPDAESTLKLALAKYLREKSEEIVKQAKPANGNAEDVTRVALGVSEIARLLEHGGEIRGLVTKGEGGVRVEPAIDTIKIEGATSSTKFLPRGAEGSAQPDQVHEASAEASDEEAEPSLETETKKT